MTKVAKSGIMLIMEERLDAEPAKAIDGAGGPDAGEVVIVQAKKKPPGVFVRGALEGGGC